MSSYFREFMEFYFLILNSLKSGNIFRKRLLKEIIEKLVRLGIKLFYFVKLFDNLKEKF